MEKSIEERARELGVPVIQPVERKLDLSQYHQQLAKPIPSVEAICGGCGKAIYQGTFRSPCGAGNCPFGVITNYASIL